MAKTRLLQAVCTVAMLAAVPALAQNSTSNPPAQPAPTDNSSTGMAPANQGGAGSSESHMTHRSAMGHPNGMMRSRTDTSQNAAVDRLNEQSYQAAQQGQTYGGVGGSGATMTPGRSGGTMAPNGPGSTSSESMPSNGGTGIRP